jgi:hypothetical protein
MSRQKTLRGAQNALGRARTILGGIGAVDRSIEARSPTPLVKWGVRHAVYREAHRKLNRILRRVVP